MTLEEKPLLYRAGEKPSTLGKYGPSAVRDVAFIDKGGNGKPLVSVKQRKNGQYVVVEKLPTKNYLQSGKFTTVEQSLAETGVNFRSIRPSWKHTSTNYRSGPNPYVGHYKPGKYTRSLPPIDLGWKADALVGSMMNAEHQPGGGDVQIFRENPKWKAKAKVGSLDNVDFNRSRSSQSDPTNEGRRFSSRYGALANVGMSRSHYTPGGAEVIRKNKAYENINSRVGSLDNARRRESKIGSLENISHQPQGGDIYILNQRLTWQSKARIGSLENISHQPQVTTGRVPHYKTDWQGRARVGSLENIHHTPRGGQVMITNRKLRWKSEAKINSLPPKREYYDADEELY